MSLRKVRTTHSQTGALDDLCVLYAQDPWGQRQRDQGGREQHLEAGDIALARLRLLIERIGGVYAVAVGGTCTGFRRATSYISPSHTDAKMAVVLVKGHKVHGTHGDCCPLCLEAVGGILDSCRAWTWEEGRTLALWAAVGRSEGGLEEAKQQEQHVYVSAITSSLEGNRLPSDAPSAAASRATPGIR